MLGGRPPHGALRINSTGLVWSRRTHVPCVPYHSLHRFIFNFLISPPQSFPLDTFLHPRPAILVCRPIFTLGQSFQTPNVHTFVARSPSSSVVVRPLTIIPLLCPSVLLQLPARKHSNQLEWSTIVNRDLLCGRHNFFPFLSYHPCLPESDFVCFWQKD